MKNTDRRVTSTRILAKEHIVSNDTRLTGLNNNNNCIIGPSGAGKTGGFVVPNLMMAEDSIVVADTKGQLHKKYGDHLRNRGYRVLCVDFVHPERSATYNPLDFVRRRTGDGKVQYSQMDLKKIAKVIIPDERCDEPFWSESGRLVLISLMAYVLEELEKEEQHFGSVVKLYSKLTEEAAEKSGVSFFMDREKEDPESFAVKMYHMYNANFQAEKCWSSIQQFVANALDVFIYNDTRSLFNGRSTIDFAELGREKTVLFVNISDTDRCMDSIVNIFYTQMLQRLCEEADLQTDGRLRVPVRVILDDFAANVYIPDFDKITSVIRSRLKSLILCENLGIVRRNGFLYLKDHHSYTMRVPGSDKRTRRDIMYIAPEELAAGMHVIIEQNVSIGKDGLYHLLAKELGFQRLTENMILAFDEALYLLNDLSELNGSISLKKQ